MIQAFFLLTAFLFSHSIWAAQLRDYSPYEYDVRFTNPVCADHFYPQPVTAVDGSLLYRKPANAFCKNADFDANFGRAGTPSEKLMEWINDPSTSEIFLSYFSFSNTRIVEALCGAMQNRRVQVRVVLDAQSDAKAMSTLEACGQENFQHDLRGHVPGIEIAHNKLIIVNPRSTDAIRISFSSGNMTAGLVLHHENWHFITTHVSSHFSQSHLCLMEGELNHASNGQSFRAFMRNCLKSIATPPEDDVQIFFVPGQGAQAKKALLAELASADRVKIAAHRFSLKALNTKLSEMMKSGQLAVQFVFDDDLYWGRAPNAKYESEIARTLTQEGAHIRYLETNSADRLLHHNKFMVFSSATARSAFVGAGNFTESAFSNNWENFYLIRIPEVVQQLNEQFDHMFQTLGTPAEKLPLER